MKINKAKARKAMRQKNPSAYRELIENQIDLLLSTFPPNTKIYAYEALPGEVDIDRLGLDPIPEDLNDAINDPADVYLIPMIGANNSKYRLGRGTGFYDRLLKKVPHALAVGVISNHRFIEFQEEGHDVPMDIIITETGQR